MGNIKFLCPDRMPGLIFELKVYRLALIGHAGMKCLGILKLLTVDSDILLSVLSPIQNHMALILRSFLLRR